MKTSLLIALFVMALTGCAHYRGGSGAGYETGSGADISPPPTDFGRGGNRANPPPFDTQSGAVLPETENMDLHGMGSDKFPPPH